MTTKDVGNLRTRLSFENNGKTSLEGFRRDLKGLRSEMNLAKSSGKDFSNSLKGMKSQSDILTRTLKTQEERIKELRHRYDESVKAKGEDANQTRDLAAQLNNATAQMNRTEQQLKNLNDEIKRQESPWTKLGNVMDKTGDKMQKIGKGMTDFGKSYSMRVTAPIVAGGIAAFKASMDYESAFAGVRKTVDATEEEFAKLSAGIREMSKVLPTSATDIAAVGEAAGQLGIKTENILGFTRVMIDLGEATNMTSETAATEFARFANIVGMSQKDFDKLGSVVVDLGNNLATTEAEIVSMAMRLAGAGAQVGLTEAEIMAFSGALSSVGIAAEAGGSAFSKVMINMQLAAELGGDELKEFGKVAGMSASDFKKAFQTDAAGAIISFIKGLSTAEERGMSAIAMLDEMGISEVRMRDALLRAAGASGVFTESIALGTKAWKENTALTEEAEQRYATTESQLKMMWNRIKDVAITMGDALVPAVMSALDAAKPLIEQIENGAKAFSEMDEEQQRTILKFIALAAAAGPVAVVLGSITTTIGGVISAGGALATAIGGSGGLIGVLGGLSVLGPVGLAVGGVAALSWGIVQLTQDQEGLHEISTERIDKMYDEADALESLVKEYDELKRKSKLSNDEFGRMIDIHKDLEVVQSPDKVERLQKEYERLLEKSELSNDEFLKMYELNNDIVEQSPTVEKSFSEKGNQIVESTDAVKEYIGALRDMAWIELEMEKVKALENEAKLREENVRIAEELKVKEQEIKEIMDMRNMTHEEIEARVDKINKLYSDGLVTAEDNYELDRERHSLLQVLRGDLLDNLEVMQEERNELIKQRDLNDEQIAQLENINIRMAEILLAEVDINYEGGKGVDLVEKKIELLRDERNEITKNITEEDYRSGKYRGQLEQLDESIKKHESVRDRLKETTGYQSTYNDTQELINANTERQKALLGSNYIEQEKNNKKIDEAKKKADELNEKLEKDVDKDVKVTTSPKADDLNKELSNPISRVMNIITRGAQPMPTYATGTDRHPGGQFLAGEEGYELGRLGNRWEMLNFGLYDRPRGYEVFTHNESLRILNAMNNIPKYATGARPASAPSTAVNDLNKGSQTTVNLEGMFSGANFSVKNEQDIPKLAKEIGEYIKMSARKTGVIR